MNTKPLVLSEDGLAQVQRLQQQDDLDIPLQAKFDGLERRYRLLLADYVKKFGPVAELGDENAVALAQV